MSRLPDVDDTLGNLPIEDLTFADQLVWVRSAKLAFDPVYYSKDPDNRFSSPSGRFGVLNLGESLPCALGESICRNAATKKQTEKIVSMSELRERGLFEITLLSPVRLLDFSADNLARYRLDARIYSERDDLKKPYYQFGPAWAEWAFDRGLDGILFPSRHTNLLCLALFENSVACTSRLLHGLDDDVVLKTLDTIFDWGLT